MNHFQHIKLNIDEEFKALIPPLSVSEYEQLEENLIKKGCRDPICVWEGIIIDGHNRYEICNRHEIPYTTQCIDLNDRNEVIAWICINQIDHRNMTEETRRYLIGKRYETEKYIQLPNLEMKNQHSSEFEGRPKFLYKPISESRRSKTARRLGEEYHLSHATIEKYAIYTRAIDILVIKDHELVAKILSGQTKVSQENVVELSRLTTKELKRIDKQIVEDDRGFAGYIAIRKKIISCSAKPPSLSPISVKDMPEFDPDAEISSLTLTIPSWISSIRRTQSEADFTLVSDKAKNKLINMLSDLKEAADTILCITKG